VRSADRPLVNKKVTEPGEFVVGGLTATFVFIEDLQKRGEKGGYITN
jgi:hypothetical protein